jgi:hypothetical protein
MGRLSDGIDELVQRVDWRVGWHRLPRPLGIYSLIRMRARLRARNLHDTGLPAGLGVPADRDGDEVRHRSGRETDGTYTDLEHPLMGSTGTRFGRNVPLEYTQAEEPPRLYDPNPRRVSLELMTREEFQPATTLNVLAAAWTQFEVHDWFSHGRNDPAEPWEIPLDETDDWPERPMRVLRTTRDRTPPADGPQTWITADTHWWDASQLYGRTKEFVDKSRAHEGGRLRVDPDGMLPADLEEQARGSRFYRQYDPRKAGFLARPAQLPGTNLEGAFESPLAQPPAAAASTVQAKPAPVATSTATRTPTATATPTAKATPGVPR